MDGQRVRAGLEAVREGNFGAISQYFRKRLGAQIAPLLDGAYVRQFEDRAWQVPWLDLPGSPVVAKVVTDGGATYHTVGSSAGAGQAVKISPPEPVVGLSIPIVDTLAVERLQLSARGTDADGETVERTVTYSGEILDRVRGSAERWPVVTVPFTFDRPIVEATVSVEDVQTGSRGVSLRNRLAAATTGVLRAPDGAPSTWKTATGPQLGVPRSHRASVDDPPIFLISVDTLRYDARDAFSPLIEAMGDDAFVPAEPRTQGHWTRPSHATMLTGAHPGHHGYAWHVPGTINEALPSVAELLAERAYTCSACVTQTTLGPEWGFGRGFHRYAVRPMSHHRRRNDAAAVVDRAIRWLETDMATASPPFYFLHLFDPHYPYVPPMDRRDGLDFDMERVVETLALLSGRSDGYVRAVTGDGPAVDEEALSEIAEWYRRSAAYTATQLRRFVEALRSAGLFEVSLVIVTGDHGEDFLEHSLGGHRSLYDANIRPLLIVKPPAGSDISPPAQPDTLDFLPTIATLVGANVPEYCDGRAWQSDGRSNRHRITEAIEKEHYLIAVEADGQKAIYTYDHDFPGRPSRADLEAGPVYAEYFQLDRDAGIERAVDAADVPTETMTSLESAAESFVRSQPVDDRLASGTDYALGEVSPEAARRLEELGYK